MDPGLVIPAWTAVALYSTTTIELSRARRKSLDGAFTTAPKHLVVLQTMTQYSTHQISDEHDMSQLRVAAISSRLMPLAPTLTLIP